MTKLLTALLLLGLALPTQAEPHHKLKVLGRIALYGAAGFSTFEFAHQTNLCRDRVHDPAPCQGGYGEVGARQKLNGGFTGLTIVLSEVGNRKHYKEWFAPVVGATVYNSVTAFQQARIHAKPAIH